MRYQLKKVLMTSANSKVSVVWDQVKQKEFVRKEVRVQSETLPALREEFRILSALSHPHLLKVENFGEDSEQGSFFWIGEYIQGTTLEQSPQQSIKEKVNLLVQILRGLEFLHAQGLVHLDIKPSNLLVDKSGKIKIIDFGFSHKQGTQNFSGGTLDFASPEQIFTKSLDGRSDLYSLGITAYFWLTGELPYTGSSWRECLEKKLSSAPLPPSQRNHYIRQELDLVILKLLKKNPEARYQRAGDVIKAINTFWEQPFSVEVEAGWVGYARTKDYQGLKTEIDNILALLSSFNKGEIQLINLINFSPRQNHLFIDQLFYLSSLQGYRNFVLSSEDNWEIELLKFLGNKISLETEQNQAKLMVGLAELLREQTLVLYWRGECQGSFYNFIKKLKSQKFKAAFQIKFPLVLIGEFKKEKIKANQSIFCRVPESKFTPHLLKKFSPTQRKLLNWFALSEAGFSLEELIKLTHQVENSLLILLQTWIAQGVLQMGQKRFNLALPSLKPAILATLDAKTMRQKYHRLIKKLSEHPDQIFWQIVLDEKKQLKAKISNELNQADEGHDYGRVARLLKHLEHYTQDPEVLAKLVHYHALVGHYQAAFQFNQKLGAKSLSLSQQIICERRQAWLAKKLKKIPEARQGFSRALKLAEQAGDEVERASLQNELGYLDLIEEKLEDAMAVLQPAFATFIKKKQNLALANSRLEVALARLGKLPEAWQVLQQKQTHLASDPTPQVQVNLKMSEGFLYHTGRVYDRARLAYQEALTLCKKHDLYSPQENIQYSLFQIEQESKEVIMNNPQPERPNFAPRQADGWTEKLFEIIQDLNSVHQLSDLLIKVLDYSAHLTGASRGFLLFEKTSPKTEAQFEVRATYNYLLELDEEIPISSTLLRRVFQTGKPFLTFDASKSHEFGEQESVLRFGLKSVLCVPLLVKNKILGVIYLDNSLQSGAFAEEQSEILSELTEHASLAIHNVSLIEKLDQKQKALAEDLAKSKQELSQSKNALNETRSRLNIESSNWKTRYRYEQIIGQSKALQEVLQTVDKITDTLIPVTLYGESGTGKELIARALHFNSERSQAPFIAVNCGAVPENLAESEFFGYQKGAFTGALRDHRGFFIQASGGTLFLDEVVELPFNIQVKLLRVLQESEVRPVGSNEAIPVNFRLIVASNQCLKKSVEQKEFREDLYYRMAGIDLKLPPLRKRLEDIPLLVNHFSKGIVKKYSLKTKPVFSHEALDKLSSYDWPGNIRQLQHVLTNAIVLALDSNIKAKDLHIPEAPRINQNRTDNIIELPFDEATTWDEYERMMLAKLLQQFKGNKSEASRKLKIGRTTLLRKLS